MPRKKKVEAPAAEAEVKAAETAAEAVEAPAKKTTTRKTTAAKKTAAAPVAAEPKKAAAPKAKAEKAPVVEKAAAKAEVIIEYNDVKVSVDEIIKNAKIVVGEDKDIKVYVQPGTSKAYIVFDDQTVEMDVYFC